MVTCFPLVKWMMSNIAPTYYCAFKLKDVGRIIDYELLHLNL